jgi:hypothetical protein
MSAFDNLSNYVPVPEAGCWLWLGGWSTKGYGKARLPGRKTVGAHRLFYAQFVGDPGELHVCHKCDTPACVNPDHLFLGTNADNAADRARKGRNNHAGEKNGRAVLSIADVRSIRESSDPQRVLARRFGVSRRNVRDIQARRTWTFVA